VFDQLVYLILVIFIYEKDNFETSEKQMPFFVNENAVTPEKQMANKEKENIETSKKQIQIVVNDVVGPAHDDSGDIGK
ncbi:hypothetical protein ACTGVE_10060, partial [Streptococcus suis]